MSTDDFGCEQINQRPARKLDSIHGAGQVLPSTQMILVGSLGYEQQVVLPLQEIGHGH